MFAFSLQIILKFSSTSSCKQNCNTATMTIPDGDSVPLGQGDVSSVTDQEARDHATQPSPANQDLREPPSNQPRSAAPQNTSLSGGRPKPTARPSKYGNPDDISIPSAFPIEYYDDTELPPTGGKLHCGCERRKMLPDALFGKRIHPDSMPMCVNCYALHCEFNANAIENHLPGLLGWEWFWKEEAEKYRKAANEVRERIEQLRDTRIPAPLGTRVQRVLSLRGYNPAKIQCWQDTPIGSVDPHGTGLQYYDRQLDQYLPLAFENSPAYHTAPAPSLDAVVAKADRDNAWSQREAELDMWEEPCRYRRAPPYPVVGNADDEGNYQVWLYHVTHFSLDDDENDELDARTLPPHRRYPPPPQRKPMKQRFCPPMRAATTQGSNTPKTETTAQNRDQAPSKELEDQLAQDEQLALQIAAQDFEGSAESCVPS